MADENFDELDRKIDDPDSYVTREEIAATPEEMVLKNCPDCDGTGIVECDECGGTGEGDQCDDCEGDGTDEDGDTCSTCGGEGYEECGASECGSMGTGRVECQRCNGQGEIEA